MNPETMLSILLGGAGGALVTFVGQIWLESVKQRHEFQKARLVALQNCILLIDSLFAYGENPEAEIDRERWGHARKENSTSGIFFPDHMQNDFTHLVRAIIREQDPRKAFLAVSSQALNALRHECLMLIKSHHQVRWRTFKRWVGCGD